MLKPKYTKLETCLTPLPEVPNIQEVAGGELANWPERLNAIPPRIRRGTVRGVTAEVFQKDVLVWNRRVSYYKTVNNQLGQAGRYRNLLDMNAYLGGFAASLIEDPVWVMNVVPVEAKVNTLGVIYERGLIGTYQSWYALTLSVEVHYFRFAAYNWFDTLGAKQCLPILERMISFMPIQCLLSTKTGNQSQPFSWWYCCAKDNPGS